MIFKDSEDVKLDIGAIMKIRHGTTNLDYIASSQDTANQILNSSSEEPVEEAPVTAVDVMKDLTK